MDFKNYFVVDKKGNILFDGYYDVTNNIITPFNDDTYHLKEDEYLAYKQPLVADYLPLKPQLTEFLINGIFAKDGKLIETATPEEIEAAKPQPLPEQKTEQSELEELAMELSEMVATQAEEIAELKAGQEETNDAVMELTNLFS